MSIDSATQGVASFFTRAAEIFDFSSSGIDSHIDDMSEPPEGPKNPPKSLGGRVSSLVTDNSLPIIAFGLTEMVFPGLILAGMVALLAYKVKGSAYNGSRKAQSELANIVGTVGNTLSPPRKYTPISISPGYPVREPVIPQVLNPIVPSQKTNVTYFLNHLEVSNSSTANTMSDCFSNLKTALRAANAFDDSATFTPGGADVRLRVNLDGSEGFYKRNVNGKDVEVKFDLQRYLGSDNPPSKVREALNELREMCQDALVEEAKRKMEISLKSEGEFESVTISKDYTTYTFIAKHGDAPVTKPLGAECIAQLRKVREDAASGFLEESGEVLGRHIITREYMNNKDFHKALERANKRLESRERWESLGNGIMAPYTYFSKEESERQAKVGRNRNEFESALVEFQNRQNLEAPILKRKLEFLQMQKAAVDRANSCNSLQQIVAASNSVRSDSSLSEELREFVDEIERGIINELSSQLTTSEKKELSQYQELIKIPSASRSETQKERVRVLSSGWIIRDLSGCGQKDIVGDYLTIKNQVIQSQIEQVNDSIHNPIASLEMQLEISNDDIELYEARCKANASEIKKGNQSLLEKLDHQILTSQVLEDRKQFLEIMEIPFVRHLYQRLSKEIADLTPDEINDDGISKVFLSEFAILMKDSQNRKHKQSFLDIFTFVANSFFETATEEEKDGRAKAVVALTEQYKASELAYTPTVNRLNPVTIRKASVAARQSISAITV